MTKCCESVFSTLKQVKSKHCSIHTPERVALRSCYIVQALPKKDCWQQRLTGVTLRNLGRKRLIKKRLEKVSVDVGTTGLECGATDYTLQHAVLAQFSHGQSVWSNFGLCADPCRRWRMTISTSCIPKRTLMDTQTWKVWTGLKLSLRDIQSSAICNSTDRCQ